MKCARVRNLFSAFYDGELDMRRERALAQHLDACPACAEEYARYQVSARDLQLDLHALASDVHAPATLYASVRNRLTEQAKPAAPGQLGRLPAGLADALDRIAAMCRTPAGAVTGAMAVISCLALVFSGLFSLALRQPNTAMIPMQTRRLVAFTVRRTEDGRILTDARSRQYVLLLDARERWLR